VLLADWQTHKEGRPLMKATPNNSMDVRAKQLLCFERLLLNSKGLSGGFAPRHLSRWAASLELMRRFN
jgi:hypothetical protein